ncbi:MAG: carboxymuconolactone decarboxylase family protein [Pseudomonadales bacterium]|nr:carboxymuconolactone decarboxylase family protein [Pseudomonadales bacterium]
MTEKTRREIGEEKIKEVYAGDVVIGAEGYAFSDIMLETLFAEIWTRNVLSMRDKRILLLGMIAAQGQEMTFKIQTKAAIKNGELTGEDVRELHLMIAQYCGYPKAAAMLMPMEEAIGEAEKELADK